MANPHLLALGKEAETNSSRFTTFIAEQHYVRYVDWSFKLNYASLAGCPAGSGMTFNHIEPFY